MLLTERFVKKLIQTTLIKNILKENADNTESNFQNNIVTILSTFEKPNKIWASKIVAQENQKISKMNLFIHQFLAASDKEGKAGDDETYADFIMSFKNDYPAEVFFSFLLSLKGEKFRNEILNLSKNTTLKPDDPFVKKAAQMILKLYMQKHQKNSESQNADDLQKIMSAFDKVTKNMDSFKSNQQAFDGILHVLDKAYQNASDEDKKRIEKISNLFTSNKEKLISNHVILQNSIKNAKFFLERNTQLKDINVENLSSPSNREEMKQAFDKIKNPSKDPFAY